MPKPILQILMFEETVLVICQAWELHFQIRGWPRIPSWRSSEWVVDGSTIKELTVLSHEPNIGFMWWKQSQLWVQFDDTILDTTRLKQDLGISLPRSILLVLVSRRALSPQKSYYYWIFVGQLVYWFLFTMLLFNLTSQNGLISCQGEDSKLSLQYTARSIRMSKHWYFGGIESVIYIKIL